MTVLAHHPFWLPEKYRRRRTIGGGDAALNMLKKIGVDIILSGHVHFAYTRIVNGLIISHAGTAISNRVEADSPNSFTVIRGDRRRLSVHNRIWDNSSFAKKDALVFHRIEGDWQETAQATTGNGSYGKSEG
jgi:hypothetical protein